MADDKLISLSSSSTSTEKRNAKSNDTEDSQTSDLISLTSNEGKTSSKSRKTDDNASHISQRKRNTTIRAEDEDRSQDLSPTSSDSDRLMLPQNIFSLEGLEITSQNESNYIDASTPRPPTVDHDAQTSRRATIHKTECKYGYHFPTSPTSSMISELAKQVEKSSKPVGSKNDPSGKILLDEAKAIQLQRLQEMFPTATGPVIQQIIQIYNGREGLIKAALISLGYKRAVGDVDKQVNTQNAILLMMAKQSSRRLFDKLASYFPDRDENIIKQLMYELKELEHEIISALVSSSPKSATVTRKDRTKSEYVQRQDRDKNNALMKLRFLKTLFPQSDEIDLYHLLYCHNLNAQIVIQELEKQGHKPVNINQILATRKTKTQQAKARQQASRAAKDRAPGPNFVELHRARGKPPLNETKVKKLKETIARQSSPPAPAALVPTEPKLIEPAKESEAQIEEKEEEEDVKDGEEQVQQQSQQVMFSDELIEIALRAAENDEELAKTFLDELVQTSDEKYMQRLNLNFETDQKFVSYPCRGVQKSDLCGLSSFSPPEYITIPYEIVHCKDAIALQKIDACTFTGDDFLDIKPTYRLGPTENLAEGSKHLVRKEIIRKIRWRPGEEHKLALGSSYKLLCESTEGHKPSKLAMGANAALRSSSSNTQRQGHNPNLVQRIHPFYLPKFKRIQATN